MQASFVAFFRATVMLACLVVLPLIAVTGSADLEPLRPALDWSRGFLERALTSNRAVAAHPPADEIGAAPPFQPVAPPADASPIGTTGAAAATPPMTVIGTDTPTASDATNPGPPVVESSPARDAGRAAGGSSALEGLERRLRDLGATYYLLEKWGDTGAYYRFHCRMALADNPEQFRYFEATDGVPERAMADVVQQVERWRRLLVR
ncbi:MAG: hypothetical protein ACC645_15670 [Pirellulales bacterium]